MSRPPLADQTLLSETASAFADEISFSCTDPALTLLCEYIDDIVGCQHSNARDARELAKDKTRSWYITMIADFTCTSRLGKDVVDHLESLSARARGRDGKRDGKRKSKTARRKAKTFEGDASLLPVWLWRSVDRMSFEPSWLTDYRGASKPLSNSYPYAAWFVVRDLMTDCRRSVDRLPKWFEKDRRRVPGLDDLASRLIAEGHAEMKRVYGDDVDLSPRDDGKIPEGYTPLFSSGAADALMDKVRSA